MRVIIEVESGAAAGHKRFLRGGESIEVGRSALLDFAFENDQQMSGRHFRIVNTTNTCHIEDLDSTNGTEVNGQKISRQPLQDGDKISAGETHFVVHVEGAVTETVAVEKQPASTAEKVTIEVPVTAEYVVETVKSGLQIYRGCAESMKPALMTQQLARHFHQMLIVTPPFDDQREQQIGQPDYLFDWLPEDTRATGSPWIITAVESAVGSGIISDAWGNDTMICVYSEKDEGMPIEQLKRCAGTFAKPSVLRPLLSETIAEVAEDMLLEIEVVLVENETPENWLLFSGNDLEPLLAAMGLKKVD